MVGKPPNKNLLPGQFVRRDHWRRKKVIPDRRLLQRDSSITLVPLETFNELVLIYQRLPPCLHSFYRKLKNNLHTEKKRGIICLENFGRPIALCDIYREKNEKMTTINTSKIDERYRERNLIPFLLNIIDRQSEQHSMVYIINTQIDSEKYSNDLQNLGLKNIHSDYAGQKWQWQTNF